MTNVEKHGAYRASMVIQNTLGVHPSRIDAALEHACNWMRSKYYKRDTKNGSPSERGKAENGSTRATDEENRGGWAYRILGDATSTEDTLTVWGGSVDGARSLDMTRRLLSSGDHAKRKELDDKELEALSNMVDGALLWSIDQQDEEGGFSRCEVPWPAIEATAWYLICVSDVHDLRAETLSVVRQANERSIEYLRKSVRQHDAEDGAALGTTLKDGNYRVMPTALALWALTVHGYTEDALRLAKRLLKHDVSDEGGWGFTAKSRPNAAMSAIVLHSLCVLREHLITSSGTPTTDERYKLAADFIIDRQRQTGYWPNSIDDWNPSTIPESMGKQWRCLNAGTPWAVLALSHFPDYYRAVAAGNRGVSYILNNQGTGGDWIYDKESDHTYTWHVSQICCSLIHWRRRQDERRQWRASRLLQKVRANAFFLALGMGAIIVIYIGGSRWAADLPWDVESIFNDIIAAIIFLPLTGIAGYAFKRMYRWIK